MKRGDSSAVVSAESLVRRFGARRAVDDVSLQLSEGECLALFGPNGAGKTTLLRMLGGLLRPTTGRVKLRGEQMTFDSQARRIIGLISHNTLLYSALTARENVRFAAECHGLRDGEAATMRALERLQVADRADTAVRLLSRGLQQRVSIARALVHDPRIVLLDEPYTGLDDVGARALTAALHELRRTGAVLVMVTHHLGEGLAMATQAAVMVAGKLVHVEQQRPDRAIDIDAFTLRYRTLVSGAGA